MSDVTTELAMEASDKAMEIARLKAENASLRGAAHGLGELCDQLKAENAKLRELAKYMWPHVRHRSLMCGECKLSCDTSDECLLYEPMRRRMAELGVEVDG